jgi:hypothetical protein
MFKHLPAQIGQRLKAEYRIEYRFGLGCAVIVSSGTEFLVDYEDVERLIDYRWYRGGSGRNQYAAANVDGRRATMHGYLMNVQQGRVVDHINGDVRDNRKKNLRVCLAVDNAKNRAPTKMRVLPKGVYKQKNRYRATIKADHKFYYLGLYKTVEEASAAYQQAATKLHGEYRRT